jgi:ATP-dependent helicase/nuclease subunit A
MTHDDSGTPTGTSTTPANTAEESFIRLDGAQRELRDAFVDTDSGLFILSSDPGAGKSTTGDNVAAELIGTLYEAGVPAPEQHIAVVSFSRDDAANLAPGIADALMMQARDPQSELDIHPDTAEQLGKRVTQADDRIGTVDAVLQSLFKEISAAVGFGDDVVVGETAGLGDLRSQCLTELRKETRLRARLERLERAYPGNIDYQPSAEELIVKAQAACRERQLTVTEFKQQLLEIIEEQYSDGGPSSFADITAVLTDLIGSETAEGYAARTSVADKATIVEADQQLYADWTAAIEDLVILLEEYQSVYDSLAKQQGVVSHLDATHWVAKFFTEPAYESDFRQGLQQRYHDRLDTIIIDEAQDVSAVQHAAFAPLIDAETRVVLLADLKQTIYLWRNAQPTLLRQAIDEGEYFGIDWSPAVVAHETQTHRSRPDVAAAIDTVFDDVFTDSERGADGTIVDGYTCLDPVRKPAEGACVHIPTVTADVDPSHSNYIDPKRGVGEAEAVAKTLSRGLAAGTFEPGGDGSGDGGEDGTGPTVTLLTHQRNHIDTYTEQLEAAGLTVGNAAARLFAHPLVRLAVELCAVLADQDPERALKDISHNHSEAAIVPETRTGPVLTATKLAEVLSLWGPDVETVVDDTESDRPIFSLVHTFEELRQRHAYLRSQTPAEAIETIVEAFDLRTDPLDISDDPMRDTMALDTLLAAVESGSVSADDATFDDVVGQLKRLYAEPRSGPSIPLHDESRYDVVIKTVFQMKGGESDVIALGDIGQHIGKKGPHKDTFCTQGSAVALAPPVSEAAAGTPAVPGYSHGVFDATRTPWDYDAGYRWVAQYWATETQLAGAPSLREMARIHRAGRWRLLYVAMTRAREHLVIPLPRTRELSQPRDHWVDTLREAFEFDETVITDDGPTDRYTCQSPSGRDFDIRVYTYPPGGHGDVSRAAADSSTDETAAEGDVTGTPGADNRPRKEYTPAAATPAAEASNDLVPRFINPSTFYHLLEDPDAHLIRYLQRRQLTPPDNAVDASLGLVFDSLGPADVGDIVHTVVERIISHREQLTTTALQECTEPVSGIINTTLARSPDLAPAERRALVCFIRDCVCPQLAESRLWHRVQRADAVYLEAPADTVTRVDDVAVELQSLADIVTREGDQWAVTELKIALQDTPPTDAHRLQAQVYAWALTQQPDTGTVAAHVQHLGATAASIPVEWDPQTVRNRLAETRALF